MYIIDPVQNLAIYCNIFINSIIYINKSINNIYHIFDIILKKII